VGVDLHSSTPIAIDKFDNETELALRKFQKRHHIAPTGEVDRATAALLRTPRCGVPDPELENRYVLAGTKWEKTDLTFAIREFPGGGVTEANARAALVAAFAAWAAVTPLTFREVAANQPHDIDIRFVVRDHGDGIPFDGRSTSDGKGAVLAQYLCG
jgi:hypothetical protein